MTVREGFALGVDLGTSNTVAVLRWPDGRTRPLLFDGQPLMPSAVYRDGTGTPQVGRDALRMAVVDPARLEPNPKRRIDEDAVLLGDVETPVVDLLGAVLGAVARAAVEATGFLPPAALTHPASWGPRRRAVLTGAAARAGWPPVVLVSEPVAAARYFAEVLRRPVPVGGCVAVFDFGAGTLDIAVVRNSGMGFEVIGDGGIADLGGLDVDAALVEYLDGQFRRTAPAIWQAIRSPESVTERRQRRAFWDDVRAAKEMLSRAPVAPVVVPGLADAVHLTREELERITEPMLHRAVQEAAAVIERSGLRPGALAGLFLVGGSSRMPIVARLLHAGLGVAPTVLEQPELPVAEGAIAELVPAPTPPALVPVQPSGPVAPLGDPQPVAPLGSPHPAASPGATRAVAPSGPTPELRPAVDPWAAAAPIDPWPGGGAPTGDPDVPTVRRRWWYDRSWRVPGDGRRLLWIRAAVAVVVLGVAAFSATAWLGDDPYHPVSFTNGVSEVGRVGMSLGPSASVGETLTAVRGDSAYLAFEVDGTLHMIGYDLAARKARWSGQLPLPRDSSPSWKSVVALPDVVLVYAAQYGSGVPPRTLFGVDPGSGRKLWQQAMGGEDRVIYTERALVWVDEQQHQLHGLDPRTGGVLWRWDDPKDQYGGADSATVAMTSGSDLDGAARPDGTAFTADPGGIGSLVQIGADRTARSIDAGTGKPGAKQGNVGDYNDFYLAYQKRLLVATNDAGYNVFSYDLATLSGKKLVYSAQDRTRRVQSLVACGSGRVCILDQGDGGSKGTQLVSIDPAGGGSWRRDVPGADLVMAVGDRTAVLSSDSSNRFSRLFDGKGGVVGGVGNDQTAARINGGSLLYFSDPPSSFPDNQSLIGVTAKSGDRKPLGEIRNVRGQACSWNTQLIVCPSQDDFGIWRFAS